LSLAQDRRAIRLVPMEERRSLQAGCDLAVPVATLVITTKSRVVVVDTEDARVPVLTRTVYHAAFQLRGPRQAVRGHSKGARLLFPPTLSCEIAERTIGNRTTSPEPGTSS